MHCKSPNCGFRTNWDTMSDPHCMMCGSDLRYSASDFLALGKGGVVKAPRAGQVEMGTLVEDVIRDRQNAVIEGPVGIGKSFGYLIPALTSGARVVVSTAKKGLQQQLYSKDLPYLIEKTGIKADVVMIKGASNYACRLKVFNVRDKDARDDFKEWLDKSPTGDVSDYPTALPPFWHAVTAEDCVGADCKFAEKCAYYKNKKAASSAQIIVANHYITAYDLRFGVGSIFKPYSVLIIDEAHQVDSSFRGAFSAEVKSTSYQRLIRALDTLGMGGDYDNLLERNWQDMFRRLPSMQNADGELQADPFGSAGTATCSTLNVINKEVLRIERDPEDEDERWKAKFVKQTIERLRTALVSIATPDDNTVLYASEHNDIKTVCVAPINVGAMVRPALAAIQSVIVTSATIAINGSFDDIKNRVGLGYTKDDRPTRELILASPFNYKTQAVLYTPSDTPLPTNVKDGFERREYIERIADEVAWLINRSCGNAFVLFTSAADMHDVETEFKARNITSLPILVQGTDGDAESVLKKYMNTKRSVLFGLKSFWEGVDVVGGKLRLVIIVKLPFPMLTDPVLQARSRVLTARAIQRGLSQKDAELETFNKIIIPTMITDLRQGAGRLIRSVNDRGVCAILDPRVLSGSSKNLPNPRQAYFKGYGNLIKAALGFPSIAFSKDKEFVEKYLEKLSYGSDS